MVVLTSFPPPTEGIKVFQPNTEVHVGSRNLGKGTVYIAESRVSWVSDNGQGFSLEYPAISLHAVSRDYRAYPLECLYLMIDAKIDDLGRNQQSNTESAEDDNENDDITEIRFVPDDKGMLDALFHAMSECQSLHPDPEDSVSEEEEDDDDDEDFDTASEDHVGANGTHRDRTAGNGDEMMDVSQFEDAEGEPQV